MSAPKIFHLPNEITAMIAANLCKVDLAELASTSKAGQATFTPYLYASVKISVWMDDNGGYADSGPVLCPVSLLGASQGSLSAIRSIRFVDDMNSNVEETEGRWPAEIRKVVDERVGKVLSGFSEGQLRAFIWECSGGLPGKNIKRVLETSQNALTELSILYKYKAEWDIEPLNIPSLRKLKVQGIDGNPGVEFVSSIVEFAKSLEDIDLAILKIRYGATEMYVDLSMLQTRLYPAMNKHRPKRLALEEFDLEGLSPEVFTEHMQSLTLRRCSDIERLELNLKELPLRVLHLLVERDDLDAAADIVESVPEEPGLETLCLIVVKWEGDEDELAFERELTLTASVKKHSKTLQNLSYIETVVYDAEEEEEQEAQGDDPPLRCYDRSRFNWTMFPRLKEVVVPVDLTVVNYDENNHKQTFGNIRLDWSDEMDEEFAHGVVCVTEAICTMEKLYLIPTSPEERRRLHLIREVASSSLEDSIVDLLSEDMQHYEGKPTLKYVIIGQPGTEGERAYRVYWIDNPLRGMMTDNKYLILLQKIDISADAEMLGEKFELWGCNATTIPMIDRVSCIH